MKSNFIQRLTLTPPSDICSILHYLQFHSSPALTQYKVFNIGHMMLDESVQW